MSGGMWFINIDIENFKKSPNLSPLASYDTKPIATSYCSWCY